MNIKPNDIIIIGTEGKLLIGRVVSNKDGKLEVDKPIMLSAGVVPPSVGGEGGRIVWNFIPLPVEGVVSIKSYSFVGKPPRAMESEYIRATTGLETATDLSKIATRGEG